MRPNFNLILATLLVFLAPTMAFAELDAELAEVGSKNEGGLFMGGAMNFGQSYATGKSNPGLGYLASFEAGYVAIRDSWGRIEVSGQFSSGKFNYTTKGDNKAEVDLPIRGMLLARLGYGWSLGHSLFGLMRIGAGPVSASYTADFEDGGSVTDSSVSGLAAQLGFDIVAPMSSFLDVTGGLALTHVALDIDKIKEPANLNVPMISLGARIKF